MIIPCLKALYANTTAGSVISMILSFILGHIPCLGAVAAAVLGLAIGLAVTAATFFFLPQVALTSEPPVDAMRRTLEFTRDNLQPTAILGLIFLGLTLAGFAVCGVGIVLTMPMAMVIQILAYRRYFVPRTRGTV